MRHYTKTFDTKEMNLKVAARGYFKIHEDPNVAVRDFEVGNSHLKVEQIHDVSPGPVKHIKPEDYDGPQRSRRLEAYHKAHNREKFVKDAKREDSMRMSQIMNTCRAIINHPLATASALTNFK
jgi:hypothetical protein